MNLEEPKFIKRFRIVVVPGKEFAACEIWYQHQKWAEIVQHEQVMVQFYPLQLELPLEAAIEALEKAKKIFLK